MFFNIPYHNPSKYPQDKKIWVKVRFLHETDKAVSVLCEGRKIWIGKSRIYKIKFKKNVFEIYTKESSVELLGTCPRNSKTISAV